MKFGRDGWYPWLHPTLTFMEPLCYNHNCPSCGVAWIGPETIGKVLRVISVLFPSSDQFPAPTVCLADMGYDLVWTWNGKEHVIKVCLDLDSFRSLSIYRDNDEVYSVSEDVWPDDSEDDLTTVDLVEFLHAWGYQRWLLSDLFHQEFVA